MDHNFFVGLVFFCGHLRSCSRLSKHHTKPAFEEEIDVPKEDQITATAMAAVAAAADDHYDNHCI